MLSALAGVLIGAVIVVIVTVLRRRADRDLARQLLDQSQKEKVEELDAIIEQLKTSFAALSREALSSNTDDFLKLAKTKLEQQTTQADQTLEAKKKLIDARLEEMGGKLTNLNNLIQQIEKQRAEAHGSLKGQLEKASQVTNRLNETTAQLRAALANPQRRGQWGERMAEDVLRLAGFVEGVNYFKQETITDGGRPDFTFPLPDNQCVHMDVKFPLANYLKTLDAPDDATRSACTTQFLRDVRSRIKEVTTRAYIDPASGTVDYVLVFIPNEQVYGFIHEQDNTLLDEALRHKVVLCSPLTLYAVLSVIRQSAENYRLEQASQQILALLAEFKKQWLKYVEGMDRMGDRLEAASKEYQKLISTRTRQLDRQLERIEDLRAAGEEQTADRRLPTD
jgi:DNA recombination protein RmuC